ncbi:unnamed protein product [Lepeophtheirus salmonis]|uniref:(salmon louse) hypothetical protein n=1 Tax=Lepeophtheirus salmonis TaxID=72036 RepID=A0A7R8H0R0_LEPSM|nr:unnamed protein product [Lepeophtheirus salmonis]CAF2773894.1 unnamed protein product [Lepeophtheirus salmonis]
MKVRQEWDPLHHVTTPAQKILTVAKNFDILGEESKTVQRFMQLIPSAEDANANTDCDSDYSDDGVLGILLANIIPKSEEGMLGILKNEPSQPSRERRRKETFVWYIVSSKVIDSICSGKELVSKQIVCTSTLRDDRLGKSTLKSRKMMEKKSREQMDEAFCGAIQIPIPNSIQTYNKHMGV